MKNKMKNMVRTLVIWILHIQTARAFQVSLLKSGLGKPGNALEAYAEFTRRYAGTRSKEERHALQKRMYRISFNMGTLIRRILFIRTEKRAGKVICWLYRNIGIDLVCTDPDKILVRSCYFSQFYDPSICRVMSAMDKGIFAGIYGGGALSFSERITEHHSACKASLDRTKRRYSNAE